MAMQAFRVEIRLAALMMIFFALVSIFLSPLLFPEGGQAEDEGDSLADAQVISQVAAAPNGLGHAGGVVDGEGGALVEIIVGGEADTADLSVTIIVFHFLDFLSYQMLRFSFHLMYISYHIFTRKSSLLLKIFLYFLY
jgi:hypothetical protein